MKSRKVSINCEKDLFSNLTNDPAKPRSTRKSRKLDFVEEKDYAIEQIQPEDGSIKGETDEKAEAIRCCAFKKVKSHTEHSWASTNKEN